MELWELTAREAVRDLVARYNANGDTGRFAQVLDLFAPDAVMVVDGVVNDGIEAIATIFTGARDAARSRSVRHMTATHQIDVTSPTTANGRCYFQVLTEIGLDHWGRYVDEYRVVDGTWRFSSRRVTVDGRSAASLFLPPDTGAQ